MLDGRPLPQQTPWRSGEPNNHGGDEHCLWVDDRGYWDAGCTGNTWAYICDLGE